MAVRYCLPADNLALLSTAVLDASSEDAEFPVANLQHPWRSKKWQSVAGTGDAWMRCTHSGSSALTVVAMADVVKHSGGTVKLQGWTGAVWSDLLTLTLPSFNPTGIVAGFQASASHAQHRVYFTNTGAVNAAVSIGAIHLGAYDEPSVKIPPGLRLRRIDPSEISMSPGGQRSVVVRAKRYVVEGASYRIHGSSIQALLAEMYEAVGIATPFFLILDSTSNQLMLYANFGPSFDHEIVSGTGWHADAGALTEAM